ncbi:MAG TPA: hypothetical protein DCR44_03515 [Acholeplasmatales bacterium]|nr:MAG: hypothetical protein A2Y16_01150 [Tenericutes bacterium GWF2_57_13]HAQ56454.1 hypothetical protein [Acholeplasmatales bacterium]
MKKEASSKHALNMIRYLGGGLFLLSVLCLVTIAVLERNAVSRDVFVALSIVAIVAVFSAIGVVSVYLKPLLLDLIGLRYDRLNANPVSSVAAPSSPEAMRAQFRVVGFVEDGDLLIRTNRRSVYAALIRRTADFTNEVHALSERFTQFLDAGGKKTGKKRILFAIYYMNRVAQDDFETVKAWAVNQRTLASFMPFAMDTLIPILYDETVQAFRFMDGGPSRFRGYDVALRFFQQQILG